MLLGRASGAPAMLRLPASSDGDDELVVPKTGDGIETTAWRQRAGATAVLAKLELGTEDLRRLLRFAETFMLVLLSADLEARRSAS
eukprot:4745834-Pleurochrysis_carterae.AAC.1